MDGTLLLPVFKRLLCAAMAAGLTAGCLLAPSNGRAHAADILIGGTIDRGSGKEVAVVEIRQIKGKYRLLRNGEPYFIKGVGGDQRLAAAAAAGANSVRTWRAKNAGAVLSGAEVLGMTVLLGIWLSHDPADYFDDAYKAWKIDQVDRLLDQFRNHPSLLMWALGNEVNLEGTDTDEAWRFVDDLARRIKHKDPLHPVITVVSFSPATVDRIARLAPALDAIGINAYASLPEVRAMIDKSAFSGPYLITEWGVDGHWEVPHTAWGRPIEPSSAAKAENYYRRYRRHIAANNDRCLGSYVFLWGQKQERTPTWYSMFVEDIPGIGTDPAPIATVDVMKYSWSGVWPENLAPEVTAMRVNGVLADNGVRVFAGEEIVAEVTAADPENAPLQYVWELLVEPSELGSGGSFEPRPPTVGAVVTGGRPVRCISAPDKAGAYRLFVYVVDDNGRIGTANIPLRVE